MRMLSDEFRFNRKKRRRKGKAIPKNLSFLTRERKIKPKIIKAVVAPFCEMLGKEYDEKLAWLKSKSEVVMTIHRQLL